MGVSLGELRRRCQAPVRGRNDVAGLLLGDRASLPLTKLFVDLGISPDVATLGMLATGLVGAACHALGGGWLAVAGAALLLLYYVLDCVDGEVARFRGVEDMKWGYLDFLFHMLVKPSAFLGVGVGLWRPTDEALYLLAAGTASVATLWLKLFLDTPGLLFVKTVLPAARDRSVTRFVASLDIREHELDAASSPDDGERFPLGLNLVTLRAMATNFDMGLVYLVAAALVDAVWAPRLPLFGDAGLRGAWLAFYGVVLPLDFVDYLQTYLRRGHFASEVRRLLVLAHRFDARETYREDEQDRPTA